MVCWGRWKLWRLEEWEQWNQGKFKLERAEARFWFDLTVAGVS